MKTFLMAASQIYRVSQKKKYIVLKAIILKTAQSSSMELNSLGVEHHKFTMEPIL